MNTNLKSVLVAATIFGAAGFLTACGEDEKAEAPAEAPAQMEEQAADMAAEAESMDTMSAPEADAAEPGMMEQMGDAIAEGAENFAEDVEEAAENVEEAIEEGEADHGSDDAPVPAQQAE
ncbi:MAG: hypothetical protein ACPG06_11320 [Alphaproteobacteria bacterium]